MGKQRGECVICKKEKILKFTTPRLSICDLCLNKIIGAQISFHSIREMAKKIIYETFLLYSMDSAKDYARDSVYNQKSSFSRFLLSFYESRETRLQIENLAKKIYNEKNSKIIKIREEKIKYFLENPTTHDYKMTQDEVNQVYIYRALQKGIINANGTFSERLSPEESHDIRKKIILSDGLVCGKCNKSGNFEFHLHHIVPLHKYGTNNPSNLILLCFSCHQKQHRDFRISKNFNLDKKGKTTKKVPITCTLCKYKFYENHSSQWTVCPKCNYEIKMK